MIKTKKDFPLYSLFKNTLLIGCDSLAYLTSMAIAVQVRGMLPDFLYNIDFPGFSMRSYFLPETFVLLAIMVIVFIWNSLYQGRQSFWEELLIIWRSLFISYLICSLFLFNFSELLPFMSRIVISLLFVNLFIVVPCYRFILKKILFKISFWRSPVVLFCKEEDIPQALRIAQALYKDFYLGFTPIGFFIENSEKTEIPFLTESLPVYHQKEYIPNYATVVIVEHAISDESPLMLYLYSHYRKIYFISYKNTIGSRGRYIFSERLFIAKLENQLNSYLAQFIKNLTDRILGFVLILLLSPLFIFIALLIKIVSPGSIFYQQERVGKNGVLFKMWKFRTMYINADQKLQELLQSDPTLKKEWDTYFKLKKDPRITPIGSFLRKYSLDEFPQLFNVINGTMSLVGPRPFVEGELEEINPSLLPLYAQVKPGLTGLWQVSGRNNIDRIERMNIDVWYIQNWSLSLDLLILLNTPIAVLSARGAR